MKNLTILSFLLCLLTGCSTVCPIDPASALFRLSEFDNQSGHTVSVVPPASLSPERPNVFDSLVLDHGERRAWRDDSAWGAFRPYSQSDIYYDGRYKINATQLKRHRLDNIESFLQSERFESSVEDTLTCYTYIFTPEDYNYAVEHGIDLGEPISPQTQP